MFEIFNRLNSGGVNLSAQELRMSLYDSPFLLRLLKMNRNDEWRRLLQREEPDVRVLDVEILLRCFALLLWSDQYRPSMVKFLNRFAAHCKSFASARIDELERWFHEFLRACKSLPDNAFMVAETSRFNLALFEAAFAEMLRPKLSDANEPVAEVKMARLMALDEDGAFRAALQQGTTKQENVRARLQRAKEVLHGE